MRVHAQATQVYAELLHRWQKVQMLWVLWGGVLTPEKPIQVGGTHTQFYFAVLQRVQHEWCKYVNRLQGGDSTADTTPILLVLCTSVTEGVCDDVAM